MHWGATAPLPLNQAKQSQFSTPISHNCRVIFTKNRCKSEQELQKHTHKTNTDMLAHQ